MNKTPDLLNLPKTRAVSFEQREGQYVIRGEADTGPDPCPKCSHFEFTRFGTRTQTFVDLPIHGMMATIHLARQRFRCCRCGAVSTQPLPDMALDVDDGHGHAMTRRLVEWISKAGLRLTFTEVSHQTGVHERTVRRIVAAHRRDEKFVDGYIGGMKDTDLVQLVAIDMWRAYYRVATARLPNAQVVIDKFHVVRMDNDALDAVCKQSQKTLPTNERVALKHGRGQLYRHGRDLDAKGRSDVDRWTEKLPILQDMWLSKEDFFAIWQAAKSAPEAMAMFDRWKASLPEHLLQPFGKLLTAFGNWREPIFRYFDLPVTSGYVEGLNSVIRAVNHAGHGYSLDVLRAKMLYHHGRHVLDGRKVDRRARVACSRTGIFPENTMNLGVDMRELSEMIERGEV
jgi:transposase